MLAHPTLDRLNTMGLAGMARAFDELAANAEADRLDTLSGTPSLAKRSAWRWSG